jgi:nucleotide-binding universal stress UspA family protein
VSTATRSYAIRRILVALDASRESLAALAAAVELAAKLEAELLGLFVEDINLLQLSESPYAREFLYPAAAEAPLDRACMERKLRAQAEQARRALAAAAERAHVVWSFRTVRGHVPAEVLAAAADVDLVALGRRGWKPWDARRLGSTALAAMTHTTPALLLCEHGAPLKLPVLVCYDGSPVAQHALAAAAELARGGSNNLIVLCLAEAPKIMKRLREQVEQLLEGKKLHVRCRALDPRDEASVLQAVRAEKPGILILTDKGHFPGPDPVEALLRDMDTCLMLLSDGG